MDKDKLRYAGMLRSPSKTRKNAGFGIAPILYMLGLIGVGAGVLFSSYSQSIKNNITMTNGISVKNDLEAALATMAATSVLSNDGTLLCPPGVSGGADTNCPATTPVDILPFSSGDASHFPLDSNGVKLTAATLTTLESGGTMGAGFFMPSAGIKQVDPWGHYYVVCRWDRSPTDGADPAFQVLSAGPTGKLTTQCGATNAASGNYATSMNAASAVNRASIWQVTAPNGTTSPLVAQYSATGVTMDSSGNLVVPGTATVAGDYSSTNGGITLTNGNIDLVSGNVQAVGGTYTGTLTGANGIFAGTLTAENSAFKVTTGGAFSASSGNFVVGSGGAVTAAGDLNVGPLGVPVFTVAAASGNTSVGGTLASTGDFTVGTGTTGLFAVKASTGTVTVGASGSSSTPSIITYGAINIGTTLAATGSSVPYLSVGKGTGSPALYPFYVDQAGNVVAGTVSGSFVGPLSGNVTGSLSGGSVSATTITASGAAKLPTITGPTTLNGDLTVTGTIIGTMTIGTGGVTMTGVLPIVNGGTGGSTATQALTNLGVLASGVLNTGLMQTLISSPAGTYNNVTVDQWGRVTSVSNAPYGTNGISDGLGDSMVASTNLTFNINNVTQGNWTSTGLMIGSSTAPKDRLDVYGGVAIGTTYAASGATAPTDGLIVVGSVGIGTATVDAGVKLEVNGTIEATTFIGAIGAGSISGIVGTGSGGTGTSTTFIPGSVVFAGTSGVYNQDNANFFWDSTNHRLGIGTTAPNVSLDLSNKGDALALPVGTAGARPSALINGEIRYNSATPGIEAYVNNAWVSLLNSGSGGLAGLNMTAHAVVLGEGATGLSTAGPGAVGTVLAGMGTSADPTFSADLTYSGLETNTFGTDYVPAATNVPSVVLGTSSSVRVSGTTAATTFTGIAGGADGRILRLHNAGAYTLTLSDESHSNSKSYNRIITGTGSDLVMTANSSVTMQYDSTTSRWRVIGGSGGGVPAGTTGQVQFNSGTNTFAADSNMTWDNTNKLLTVGTGAATPAAATGTVAGFVMNVIPQATTYAVSTTTGGVAIGSAATAGQMAYYSGANTIAGTPALYVSGSNIGIGTTTPGAKFVINYNVGTPSSAPIGNVLQIIGKDNTASVATFDSYGMYNTILFRRANGTAAAPTSLVSGDAIARIGVRGYGASGYLPGTNNAVIEFDAAESWNDSAMGTSIKFQTTATGTNVPTENMRLQASGGLSLGSSYVGTDPGAGGLIASGNVGIGTTTPAATLAVYSSTAQDAMSVRSNSGASWTFNQYGALSSSLGLSLAYDSNVSADAYSAVSGADVFITSDASSTGNNNIILMPHGTGRVGIGTTSPDQMLTVGGTIHSTTGGVEFPDGTVQTSAASGSATSALGASAAATNPQRSGEAGTGLYTAASGAVDVASLGTQIAEFSATGLNIISAAKGLKLGGVNGISYPASDSTSIAIGSSALVGQTSAASYGNTAIGYQAVTGTLTTVAKYNTAVGYQALNVVTSGSQNTAIGYQSMGTNSNTVTGGSNSAFGGWSLGSITSGGDNTAIGINALYYLTSGHDNTAVGFTAMQGVSGTPLTGSDNIAIGTQALLKIQGAASQNTVVGDNAGLKVTTGSSNVIVGYNAASSTLATGAGNIVIGTSSAADTTTSASGGALAIGGKAGQYDTAVGFGTLGGETTDGLRNSAFGNGALNINNTGANNMAAGYRALGNNTSGSSNTGVGYNALASNGTSSNNTAFGYQALGNAASGANNTAVGYQALAGSTTANNTAVGYQALGNAAAGAANVAAGYQAIYHTTGASNVAVGYEAGAALTTGSNNVAIGYSVGSSTLSTGSGNILIGTNVNVDTPAAATSNFLNIGNVIFATGMTGTVASPAGNVGIGTSSFPASSGMQLQIGSDLTFVSNWPTVAFNAYYTSSSLWKYITTNSASIIQQDYTNGGLGFYVAASGTAGSTTPWTQEALFIKGNGNVGIGTTGPTTALEVHQDGNSNNYQIARFVNANTGANAISGINIVAGNPASGGQLFASSSNAATDPSSFSIINYSNAALRLGVGNVESMRIAAGGYVGIGTASPAEMLDVYANTNGPQEAIVRNANSGSSAFSLLYLGEDTGKGVNLWVNSSTRSLDGGVNTGTLRNDAGDLRLAAASTSPYIYLQSSTGYVGIGTTAPATNLDVVGQLRASTSIINGGTDFVLGTTDQSSRGNSGNSRALVKCSGATLCVNFGGDFTGGTYVGGSNAASYTLQVNGSVAGTSAYNNLSDVRLKKDIEPLAYGLDTVMKLRPVGFNWIAQDQAWKKQHQIGLIAQEVEPLISEVVTTAGDEQKTKSLAYGALVPVLIKGEQQLKALLDDLAQKVETIFARLASHDSAIQSLEKTVQELKTENATLKTANDNALKAIESLQKEEAESRADFAAFKKGHP